MAYTDAVIRRAQARLNQARQAHDAEARNRTQEIYRQYPRLREIDLQLQGTVAKIAAAAFSRGEDPAQAIAKAREENLSLQQERSWILEAAELEESDLDMGPICTDCGGSGFVGERMCQCLKELCRQEQKKELSSLLAGKESFDAFRLDVYPETPDPRYGVPPRQMMKKVFERCCRYAREFSPAARSLLFSGGTGLGKTFLSACIARSVAENGFSVVYDTAISLFRDFEAEKFAAFGEEQENRTKKYLRCDLLIIDDLGTEMTTQFTQSALYQVVNTRLMEGRATIISTNLSDTELSQRYSGPIASRLLGTYELLVFLGEDIRMK